MTTTEVAAPVSATVTVRTLRRMLAAVLPHAAGDSDMPLSVVSFEIEGGRLFLVGTDRYTVAIARKDLLPDEHVPDTGALIDAGDAGELLAMLEDRAGESPAVLAITADPWLTIDLGDRRAAWLARPASALDGVSQYPGWRFLLHASLATPEPAGLGDGFGLDPRYLARFCLDGEDARDGRKEPLMFRWAQAVNGPLTLVTRGDWFLGAVMPVRRDSADDAAFTWASWAKVTAPAEGPGAGG